MTPVPTRKLPTGCAPWFALALLMWLPIVAAVRCAC
jgi:hypothetical protein